jgi:hypothetical protein
MGLLVTQGSMNNIISLSGDTIKVDEQEHILTGIEQGSGGFVYAYSAVPVDKVIGLFILQNHVGHTAVQNYDTLNYSGTNITVTEGGGSSWTTSDVFKILIFYKK